MENLSVKLESVKGNELVIRQGEALPLQEPNKVDFAGDIRTVRNFLKGRSDGWSTQLVDKTRAIVVTDYSKMTIDLFLDPESPYGGHIKGTLEVSEELTGFHINQTKTFSRDELIKLLKFSKIYFDEPDKHEQLLKAYQAFSAQTSADIKAESDTRGNKNNAFKKTVETNLPNEFILNIPIFKGEENERFRVEICLDITDASARFWFESVELSELIYKRKHDIFQDELKPCLDFVIINK